MSENEGNVRRGAKGCNPRGEHQLSWNCHCHRNVIEMSLIVKTCRVCVRTECEVIVCNWTMQAICEIFLIFWHLRDKVFWVLLIINELQIHVKKWWRHGGVNSLFHAQMFHGNMSVSRPMFHGHSVTLLWHSCKQGAKVWRQANNYERTSTTNDERQRTRSACIVCR